MVVKRLKTELNNLTIKYKILLPVIVVLLAFLFNGVIGITSLGMIQDSENEIAILAGDLDLASSLDIADAIETNRQTIFNAKAIMTISAVMATLFSALIGWVIIRTIVEPIRSIERAAAEIAAGNLEHKIPDSDSLDELGKLTASFNSMVDSLRSLISEVKETADRVASTSEELAASSEEMNATSEEIASTANTIGQQTQKQVDEVGRASSEMDDISDMLSMVNSTNESLTEITGNASANAEKGGQTAADAVQKMNIANQGVLETAAAVKELGNRSKEIGDIVVVITSIAEQTNLLALNAAIEAARAGEHGRGFAVVAEEVRKLAEGSGKAAEQIATLIRGIQSETENTVIAMEKGAIDVGESTEVVNGAFDILKTIEDDIKMVAANVEGITEATTEQAEMAAKVLESIKAIEAAAKGASEGTEGVAAATEEQTASMEELTSSAQELALLANKLKAAVETFKI